MDSHIAVYPLPILHEHQPVEALCGHVVTDARFVMSINTEIVGQAWSEYLSSLNTCPRCFALAKEVPKRDVKYVYIVVSGEGWRTNGSEAA